MSKMSSGDQKPENTYVEDVPFITQDWKVTVPTTTDIWKSRVFQSGSSLQWQLSLRFVDRNSQLQGMHGLFGSSSSGRIQCPTVSLSIVAGAKTARVWYLVEIEDDASKTCIKSDSGTLMVNSEDEEVLESNLKLTGNSTITVKLTLFILREVPLVDTPPSGFVTDMKSLLSSREELNDITLFVGPDKEVVKANKLILMARSPVFRAMFQVGMKEQETNEVHIPDISPDACREMLTYMLSDEAPNILNMAEDVWHAAHKYELTNLQARCENTLLNQLKVENAAHILAFADKFCGPGVLRDCAMAFITKDRRVCSQVKNSDAWSEIECQSDLRYEVFCQLLEPPPTKKVKLN